MNDDVMSLTGKELAIFAELKMPSYKQDKITISFGKDNTPKEIKIDGKEFDLNKYDELNQLVAH
jgi:hypothetical protein